jgi:hypothetical protein
LDIWFENKPSGNPVQYYIQKWLHAFSIISKFLAKILPQWQLSGQPVCQPWHLNRAGLQ